MSGRVYVVGAGPGDPELLTLKALRLLRTADAVLHDDLVAPEILKLASPTAQVHNVGKRCGKKKISQEEIHFLMIALAQAGMQVVRLKGGDPLIFGRAGEEIEALRRAEVEYDIVPGITSALGAAAAAQIPLTHRAASSAVVLITAHQAEGSDGANWNKLASSGATLVIYMPGCDYSEIAAKLKSAGLAADVPCAVIARATKPDQQIYFTALAQLSRAPKFQAPSLLVVGEVVGMGDPAALLQESAAQLLDHGARPALINAMFLPAENEEPLA
ncbi:MAG: uroporphyrinogen-III C-methyltransferase [Candidatus Sulfotelmatobacter sp.]